MYLKPTDTTPGRTAIELWDAGEQVATIYALEGVIHICCESGWAPDARRIAVEVQVPAGILLGFERLDRG